jgi:hypothetical protein
MGGSQEGTRLGMTVPTPKGEPTKARDTHSAHKAKEGEGHASLPRATPTRGTVGAEASTAARWSWRRAQTRSSNSNSSSSNGLGLLAPSAHRPTTGLALHVLLTLPDPP